MGLSSERSADRLTPAAALQANDLNVMAFLEYLRVERRLSPATVLSYHQQLKVLLQRAGQAGRAITSLDTLTIERWAKRDLQAGSAHSTVALRLTVWRQLFRWLLMRGRVQSNPVMTVKRPRMPRRLPKALSVDQACALANYRRDGVLAWMEARDVAIVELLYGCGLRIGELAGLDLRPTKRSRGWIDFEAGVVVVCGKGDAWRRVPIHELAERAVEAWLRLRPDFRSEPDAMFVTRTGERVTRAAMRSMIYSRAQRACLGVPVHPHMLRHTFASHLLQSSEDLRSVQVLLGHENLASTQVYTHLDFAHLHRVYQASHPLAGAGGGWHDRAEQRVQFTASNEESQAPQ